MDHFPHWVVRKAEAPPSCFCLGNFLVYAFPCTLTIAWILWVGASSSFAERSFLGQPVWVLSSLDFLLTSHFNQKLFVQKLQFGGETSIFIKNSWPQWSDNAVFWYQQMLCLTCSLKLYSVPSYLSFPVAICWLWDVMYLPYSYARQFASNTTARNELHKMLVAITPYFPNHMEHNTLKPIDTFFYYSSDP